MKRLHWVAERWLCALAENCSSGLITHKAPNNNL